MRGAACSDKPGIITWHPAVALGSELQRMSVFQLIILVLEPSTLLFQFYLNNLVF